MVEDLKLQQDFGELVVVLDDFLGIRTLEEKWGLQEYLHGFLDTPT